MALRSIPVVLSALAVGFAWAPGEAQITQDNRFEILRTLIADTAASRALMPLGPNGLELSEDGEVNEDKLSKELRVEGRALEAGDVVTITDISFGDDKVEVELNGGGTRDRGILDRITFSAGGASTRRVTPEDNRPATGSKVVLVFDEKAPPELNSDLLKVYLSPVLDFNKQNFMDSGIESLPAEFQEAVRAREVIIGMDQSTVLMSKGRPNRRVRETVDGVQQEDWIYYENGIARHFITFEDGVVVKTVKY